MNAPDKPQSGYDKNPKRNPPQWQAEFPSFKPEWLPTIPADWVDHSWHNDTMPAFHNAADTLHIFIDGPEEWSELPGEFKRFHVTAITGGELGDVYLLDTDDWGEVLRFVADYKPEAPPADLAAKIPLDQWARDFLSGEKRCCFSCGAENYYNNRMEYHDGEPRELCTCIACKAQWFIHFEECGVVTCEADGCTDEIFARHTAREQLLRDLLEWATQMGGWDAPVWDRVRKEVQS